MLQENVETERILSSEALTFEPLIQYFEIVIHPFDVGRHYGLNIVGRCLCLLEQQGFRVHEFLNLVAKKRQLSHNTVIFRSRNQTYLDELITRVKAACSTAKHLEDADWIPKAINLKRCRKIVISHE